MQTKPSFKWFLAALFLALAAPSQAVELIPLGSTWKYFLGTGEPSVTVGDWRQTSFNDSAWPSGPGPIGYDTGGTPGTAPIATLLPDPRTVGNPVWTNTYFRKVFNVANPASITDLILTVYADDGAVAWVNGVEVGRINVPDGELSHTSAAVVADETRTMVTTNIASLLVAGNNVVAVQVLNGPAASSDFVFEALLNATLDEPPTVLSLDPPASAIVTELTTIGVIFTENVTGVNASDLLINGVAAANMTVISPREYTFSFPAPPTGVVTVAWVASPGITDLDQTPDAFVPGPSWTYTLDPNVIPSTAQISEFLADNTTGIRDEDGSRSDWIEIYNPGPVDINLGGWFLTDTTNNLALWQFPSINLAANKYLLVWASQKNKTNPLAPLHTNFRLSRDAGSYLALVNPQTNVVSAFASYPAQSANISFGRDRVDPNLVGYFVSPTPGAQNTVSGSGFAPEPIFSLESGIYTNNSLTLTLSAPAGVTIRYTFDGSEPTNNSPVYTGPITFTTNMMIKARGFSSTPGLWPSPVIGRQFVMLDSTSRDFNSNLPLLIISTHGRAVPQNLSPGAARPRGAFVVVDTFRGRSSLQQPKTDFLGFGQFEIIGQTSAGFPKQPLRVEINDELGNDKDASLLGMPAEADWNLRNPHNDKTLMNDFLGYELWEELGHYSCRRRFVEVFFDTGGGKLTYPNDYYGVMVLFERIEIGKDRVNLARLSSSMTNEPAITGGYIFKKDKDSAGDTAFTTGGGAGHSGQTLKFHDPKPREISLVQSNYIRNYVNRFEASMFAANWTNAVGTNHYSYYIDVDQFVDQHLHVEFTKQIDGYRLSSYYSKDRNGKLRPEPVWDWNLAFGNANYLQGGKTNGWYWANQSEGMGSAEHIWLRRLIYGAATVSPSGNANGPGDPDFRQKITDRWDVVRTNVLNGDRVIARINELESLLTEAAARNWAKYPGVLNSYQWPNPEGPPAWDVDFTQPTSALIVSEMRKWVQGRFTWMDNQFLRAPTLSLNGGNIPSGFQLFITAPAGTIYYTLDGTDPRASGGGIAPGAIQYTGPITLTANARVVARALTAASTPLWTPWSAPAAATFVISTPKLVITEIMYHPLPPGVGSTNVDEDFEYIELRNVGTAPLNIGGYTISGGVDFTFPSRTLAAGERVLVVKSAFAFNSRYPGLAAAVAGEYIGNLANEGNRLVLKGRVQEPILDFRYDDQWYPITDGFGFSLVIVNDAAPLDTWGLATSWRPSGALNGTPGQGDGAATTFPEVVINEALTHSDPAPPYDTIELRNLGSSPANIGGWYLTDDFRIPKKYRIPNNTVIQAGGYVTFDETSFNVGATAFSLSSSGDEVYLFSGNQDGDLSGYVQGFKFGAAKTGVTFGRHITSTGAERFVSQVSASLGAANAGILVGPVVISELMYRPQDVPANGAYWNNEEDEFVELRNITAAPVALFDPARPTNTWRLDKGVEFTFPTNTTIPANGYLLVVNFNPATNPGQLAAFRAKYGVGVGIPILGPYKGSLDNAGENVGLYQPDTPETVGANAGQIPWVLVDEVTYSDLAPWPTAADGLGHALHRVNLSAYGDDPVNWAAGAPTPGSGYVSGAAPVITAQPGNQTVVDSGLATATFSAAAVGPAPLRYQWLFNGQILNGETNSTLVINNVKPFQAGQYQCYALNPFGSALSSPGTLTVLIAPKISQQPLEQRIAEGGNAAFTVVASSVNPPLRYQWLRNGQPIPGATSFVYSINNVISDVHDGDYSVVVSDGNGSVPSAAGRLTVLLAPQLINPVPGFTINAVVGETVTFGTQIRGTKPIWFQWRKFSPAGANQGIIKSGFLNVNQDFFTTNIASTAAAGIYTIQMTNIVGGSLGAGTQRTNAVLNVVPDTNGNGIPDFWETDYFGSATGADRDADTDGDGMSNWAEYIAGTIPTNAASYLKVQSITTTGGAQVTFPAVAGRTYTVEYKDSLDAANWTRLGDVVSKNIDWTATVTDPAPATNRYYRLVTPRR